MASRKQTFLHGAMILIAANLIVKVIGALYTIPLANIIGPGGMGYYNSAYEIYSFLFILSTAGLPVAMSKMVSENLALGRGAQIRKIFRVALIFFAFIGLLGALLLFFGAKAFSSMINNDLAFAAIMVVSPSVFFIAIMSAYRGFFQGLSDMTPTAISQVIEAFLKLTAGFAASILLVRSAAETYVVGAGAISGVTLGTVFGSIVLTIYFLTSKKVKDLKKLPNTGKTESTMAIAKKLIRYAVPITIGASVLSLTNVIDLMVVMNRLGDIGFSQEEANTINGAYGMARKLFNLPPSIIAALGVSVLPILSAANAVRDTRVIKVTMETALRICTMFAIPAGLGLTCLSGPILSLLYFSRPEAVEIATPLLTLLGFSVVFVSLVTLSNAMLQAIGLMRIPVITMLVGGTLKLVTNYVLIGIPSIGIKGAPVGTLLCYGSIMLLNLVFLIKNTESIPNLIHVFLKPVIAGVVMAAGTILSFYFLEPMLGGKIAVILSMGLAGLIYFIVLLTVKGISAQEVKLLPKGEKIAEFLSKKGLI